MGNIEKAKAFANGFVSENNRFKDGIIELLVAVSVYCIIHGYEYNDTQYMQSLFKGSYVELDSIFNDLREDNEAFVLYKVFVLNTGKGNVQKVYELLKILINPESKEENNDN